MLAGSESDTQHNTSLVRLCTTAFLHSGLGGKLDAERNGSLDQDQDMHCAHCLCASLTQALQILHVRLLQDPIRCDLPQMIPFLSLS
jgi:hypothetical protein